MSTSHQNLDGLSGSLLGIATIVVGLRFFARHAQNVGFKADDWTMIPAYICFVGLIGSIFSGTAHRTLGYSSPEVKGHPVPPQIGVSVNRAVDVFAAAYFGCVKASALFFFQRVFCLPGKIDALTITIRVLLVLTLFWTLLYIFLPIFQCGTHFSAAWSGPASRAQYCTISDGFIESQSVSDVVFDILILLLPIPKILSLHTSMRRRIAVVLVFSTAIVSLAASIAKAVIVFQVDRHSIGGDPLLDATEIYFMWILEAGFAIIAVNLPTLIWLRSSKAPEKMLASVRSLMSLKSQRSQSDASNGESKPDGAQSAAYDTQIDAKQMPTLTSEELGLVPHRGVEHETTAVPVENSSHHTAGPGHIEVRSHLDQKFETV